MMWEKIELAEHIASARDVIWAWVVAVAVVAALVLVSVVFPVVA
jgi:hypothetical protein